MSGEVLRSQPSGPRRIALNTLSRRRFLKGSAEVAVLSAMAGLIGCDFRDAGEESVAVIPDQTWAYADNVPPAPEEVDRDRLGFLTESEAETVEAFTARLMPGTPDDPGAREAGVLTFIDTKLSRVMGFWEPTYFEPPFAETYTGEPPPEQGPPFDRIFVAEDELERYGFQAQLTPREVYRMGLRAVDELAQEFFGARFAELSETQQDEVVGAIANDEAPTFEEPSASLFFETIRQDTVFGMFADPAYGGNRDMVGWRLIGYPGAQRAYTPDELQSEDPPREPQSLEQLHAFNPGVPVDCDIVLPVSDPKPDNQQVPATRE